MQLETVETFSQWLEQSRICLLGSNSDALISQFSHDVQICTTPFEAPRRGAAALSQLISEVLPKQQELDLQFQTIGFRDKTGWAHFSCSFTRPGTDDPVRFDGVLQLHFTGSHCHKLSAWWHRLEPGQGDLMRDVDA